jgi:hypothetical protein
MESDFSANWLLVAALCATIAYYVAFHWYSAAARIERRANRKK